MQQVREILDGTLEFHDESVTRQFHDSIIAAVKTEPPEALDEIPALLLEKLNDNFVRVRWSDAVKALDESRQAFLFNNRIVSFPEFILYTQYPGIFEKCLTEAKGDVLIGRWINICILLKDVMSLDDALIERLEYLETLAARNDGGSDTIRYLIRLTCEPYLERKIALVSPDEAVLMLKAIIGPIVKRSPVIFGYILSVAWKEEYFDEITKFLVSYLDYYSGYNLENAKSIFAENRENVPVRAYIEVNRDIARYALDHGIFYVKPPIGGQENDVDQVRRFLEKRLVSLNRLLR